uniref:Uncharacterized protein n=1 Tax=Rhizophagus irregularis (strain DAOM 181602 / DAOM 197198 / MUCL 43194) TaxID=747089 RepID=U9TSW9_RHIID
MCQVSASYISKLFDLHTAMNHLKNIHESNFTEIIDNGINNLQLINVAQVENTSSSVPICRMNMCIVSFFFIPRNLSVWKNTIPRVLMYSNYQIFRFIKCLAWRLFGPNKLSKEIFSNGNIRIISEI